VTRFQNLVALRVAAACRRGWSRSAPSARCQPRPSQDQHEFRVVYPLLAFAHRFEQSMVRAIHNTASTNSRLSRAVTLGSPALPGSSAAMFPLIVSQDSANQGRPPVFSLESEFYGLENRGCNCESKQALVPIRAALKTRGDVKRHRHNRLCPVS